MTPKWLRRLAADRARSVSLQVYIPTFLPKERRYATAEAHEVPMDRRKPAFIGHPWPPAIRNTEAPASAAFQSRHRSRFFLFSDL